MARTGHQGSPHLQPRHWDPQVLPCIEGGGVKSGLPYVENGDNGDLLGKGGGSVRS